MSTQYKTPVKLSLKLKPDFIAIDKKWEKSAVHIELKSLFNGVLIEDLKNIDFYFNPERKIIYLKESASVMEQSEELLNLEVDALFIANRNTLTVDAFSKLQDVFHSRDRHLLPVGNVSEVPLLLHQLHLSDITGSPAPFLQRSSLPPDIQLNVLLSIPGLGRTKAAKLLANFGTIQKIAQASESDLVPIIGISSSTQVYQFFHEIV